MRTIIDNVRIYRPFKEGRSEQLYYIEIDDGKIRSINKGRTNETGAHVHDASERVAAAAFNDSHLHLLRYGIMKKEMDFRKVTSWQEMKDIIHSSYWESQIEEHDWIVGNGLEDDKFQDVDHLLTARDLEEIEYEKPACFLHDDGHECVVNELGMKIIKEEGILNESHERFIEKDKEGNWTGRFTDTATHVIHYNFRQKNEEEIYIALLDALPHLLEAGITSVHTDDFNFAGDFKRVWDSYRRLEEEGKLKVHVVLHHYVYDLEHLKLALKENSQRTGDGTERVKMGAIKIFLDGTQRLHSAALREPYADKPDTRGNLIYTDEELNDMVRLAHDSGMQVTMHAIGDRAVDQALNALEQVDIEKLRHRIIHGQVLAPDLFDRIKRLGVCLEVQPGFMISEYKETVKWVGVTREKYCNAWGSVDAHGILYTGSSDCPIGPLSPLENIFAAVNRTDNQGIPEGGWIPEEKLSVDSIYKAYTETPAYIEFAEGRKGLLQEGYEADIVLLSSHPKEVEQIALKDIEVVETWIAGEKVYSKDN
ncbi:amidohydrolase [Peribacillus sp. SCS-155]|uniref:amidohydrolase n=1 Tax=Peribacillus sedimenti TaxID=3115297 RepID=UPI003906C74A